MFSRLSINDTKAGHYDLRRRLTARYFRPDAQWRPGQWNAAIDNDLTTYATNEHNSSVEMSFDMGRRLRVLGVRARLRVRATTKLRVLVKVGENACYDDHDGDFSGNTEDGKRSFFCFS